MVKYFQPKHEVIAIISDMLKSVQPANVTWDIPQVAEATYTQGALPYNIASSLVKDSVIMLNAGLRDLQNCGCAGARADLTRALKTLNAGASIQAAASGTKQMAINTTVKLKQFISTVVAKD